MSHSENSQKAICTLEIMLSKGKTFEAMCFIEKKEKDKIVLPSGNSLGFYLAARHELDLLKWCTNKGFASRFNRTIKNDLSLLAAWFSGARSKPEEMKPKLADGLVELAEFLDFPRDKPIIRDAIDTFVQQYASEASKKIFFKSSDMSLGETSSGSDSLSDSGSDSLPGSDSSSVETPFVLLRDSEKDATRGLRRRHIPASIDPH